jgi:hypothetical protein
MSFIAALLLALGQDLASGIVVEGKPTPPLPEGAVGLAAKYPGDLGIEKDPDVVFAESFEGTVPEISARWDQAAGQPLMSKSDDVPPGSGGKQSLLLTRVAGGTGGYQDGGNFYRRLDKNYEKLHFRFYMKFNQDHAPIHHYGAGFWGIRPPSPWPIGAAGVRPKGDHLFITQVEPADFTTWYFYSYWQHMGGSPPRGQTWGNSFELDVPPRPVAREQWICLELMVKMNDVGDTNGEQAYWIDGKLSRKGDLVTSYLGKGFPSSGTWVYDKFFPGVTKAGVAFDDAQKKGVSIPGGRPFPGFAWRSVPDLALNAIWLYRYMSKPETGTSKVWWDHLVVSKNYVGPIKPK